MLYKVPELNEIYTKPAQRIVDPLKIHWLINLSEILKKINTIKYILLFINILEIIMSDHEEEVPQVEEVKVEACETINDALRSVIKKAQANNGLVKGLNEVCKALDKNGQNGTMLVVMASNCDDAKYQKTVTALAKRASVPLLEVETREELGEWLGHCKYDAEGNAVKVKGTSSLAITDYGEETVALAFLLKHLKENNLCWTGLGCSG